MNKTGFGVVADTTCLQGHGALTDLSKINPAELDIYRPALHVQTVTGNTGGGPLEFAVGLGRTERGHHTVYPFAAHLLLNDPENIEQLGSIRCTCPVW